MERSGLESLRNIVRPFVRAVRVRRELVRIFIYDALRFVRYSGVLRKKTYAPSTGALITKQYHRIEKGLALPAPRPGFGEPGIMELCALIDSALRADICQMEVGLAVDALIGYRDFNLSHGVQPRPWLSSTIERAIAHGVRRSGAPVNTGSRFGADELSGLGMLLSRRSVRDFSAEPVPQEALINAVRAAQHAPCVCNRQAGRVHLFRGEEKDVALSYQNGNRGFGDAAPVVALLTVDQAEMLEPTERYQHWIDGGMFAQNFLLALHAQGYGACPLNWSASVAKDKAVRKALGSIPESEAIIMLVAIGQLKEEYMVARSERRPLSDVVGVI